MKIEEKEKRICKNKKCQKILPKGYQHQYCEACRNVRAHTVKNVAKGLTGIGVTVGCVTISFITRGKINIKK